MWLVLAIIIVIVIAIDPFLVYIPRRCVEALEAGAG